MPARGEFDMDIKGQVAAITGGASGLGEATARRLAAAGAKVAIIDRDEARARLVAGEIGGKPFACDVSSASSAEATFADIEKALGAPRVLVNCAGIAIAKRMVGRDGAHSLEDFARIIGVNLIGTFNMMRIAGTIMSKLPPLEDGERGVIVSTASVAAFDGQIGQVAYSASKGGVAAMTLPVARELAQFGIRVMALAPGLFKTPLLAQLPQEAQDALAVAIPFPHRLGEPGEFAALVNHIVENRYLNGETIRLDGSLRMAPR
jgi:NAD(P)-dependent dehydrogenase (short-subunit alcohol dehydrogenase family)